MDPQRIDTLGNGNFYTLIVTYSCVCRCGSVWKNCSSKYNNYLLFFFPETLYHFGDNDREAWDSLFSLYQLPPYEVPGLEPVLSFGLAGENSTSHVTYSIQPNSYTRALLFLIHLYCLCSFCWLLLTHQTMLETLQCVQESHIRRIYIYPVLFQQ